MVGGTEGNIKMELIVFGNVIPQPHKGAPPPPRVTAPKSVTSVSVPRWVHSVDRASRVSPGLRVVS